MYSIRADQKNNRFYLTLDGFFLLEEAQAVAGEIKMVVDQLQPGFDVISDTRGFKPGSPEVASIIGNTHDYLIEHKINRFVRIVSKDFIGQMQMKRVSQKTGLDAQHVTSMEEAEALLDQ